MKCLFTIIFWAIALEAIGQSGQSKDERNNTFIFFTGVSLHAAYTGSNFASFVYLNRSTSPGVELGFRYRKTILPGFYACVSVGADYALIRNKIVAEFQSTKGFESGEHYYGFIEAGGYKRKRIFQNSFQIFVGYRLNQIFTATHGYGENNPDYRFVVESTVNPETKLFHSIVFRPEFVINSKKSQRKFIVGLQGVAGAFVSRSELVKGTYYYKSNSIEASGNILGNLAHVTILGQIYL